MKHIVFALAATLAASSFAQVTVKEPWVRATVAAQKVTGAFMQLTSAKDMKLVGVRSPIAGRAEIHQMDMEQDVMKMRAAPSIALPAGKPVTLASGGAHVMLFDLTREVKAGETIPLTLLLEAPNGAREQVEVKAEARPLATAHEHAHEHAQADEHEHGHGHGHHHHQAR
jgi:copper(I)-binding protein